MRAANSLTVVSVAVTLAETLFQMEKNVIPRSYLYVPGNDAGKLEKALSPGADALIVDLEDAVPAAAKGEARALVASWLGSVEEGAVEIWIRVNPEAAGHDDVRAVLGPRVRGLMAAKTESADQLRTLGSVVREVAERAGLVEPIGLVPLLESAAALLAAREIAAVPGVERLQVGEADLAADLGFSDLDDPAWDAIRLQTVIVSAAAGIGAPVAPVSTNFRDLAAFAASTRALAARGYLGRACIHPAQVAVANEVFTPTPEAVARARRMVQAYDDAVAAGVGVTVDEDGRMVDEAVIRNARRVIALAR
jgi:citrate lyase subunit beta/citryl-CoA lyase